MAPRGTEHERILALEQIVRQLRAEVQSGLARAAQPAQLPRGIWPALVSGAITGGDESSGTINLHRWDGTAVAPTDPATEETLDPPFGLAFEDVLPDNTPGLLFYAADRRPYFVPVGNVKATIIRFTLEENIGATTAGQASATVDEFWDGGNPATGDPFRAIVKNTSGLFPFGLKGAKGWARHNRKLDQYEIIQCNQRGTRFRAKLVDPLLETDATCSVYSCRVLSPPPFGLDLIESGLLEEGVLAGVRNIFTWAGDADAWCDFEWNANDGEWDLYQVACPSGDPPEEEEE